MNAHLVTADIDADLAAARRGTTALKVRAHASARSGSSWRPVSSRRIKTKTSISNGRCLRLASRRYA
jgi:hypothetical protein